MKLHITITLMTFTIASAASGQTGNTTLGNGAGASITTGDDNTFIGEDAGSGFSTGRRNTAVGSTALSIPDELNGTGTASGYGNSAFGFEAGFEVRSGYLNTVVGILAGTDLVDGSNNTLVGAQAGHDTVHADYCTMVGSHSGYENNRVIDLEDPSNSNRNTFVGMAAGSYNRRGSDNVMIGAFADFTQWENVAPGDLETAFSTDDYGDFTFPSGLGAGSRNINRAVVIGGFAHARSNDAVTLGYLAKTSASRAITLGATASSTHADAITIGYGAVSHAVDTVVIGNDTTAGWHPNIDAVTELGNAAYRFTNVTAHGYDAVAAATNSADIELWADDGSADDDKWRVSAADGGDFTIESFASGSYVAKLTVANTGDVTVPGEISVNSDARLKRDVSSIQDALALVNRIDGKTYHWKQDLGRDEHLHYGLIAQQVESVIPEVVTEAANGIKSVNYQALVPVLVEALKQVEREADAEICRIQEESRDLERRLGDEVRTLREANADLAARLARLEALIERSADQE